MTGEVIRQSRRGPPAQRRKRLPALADGSETLNFERFPSPLDAKLGPPQELWRLRQGCEEKQFEGPLGDAQGLIDRPLRAGDRKPARNFRHANTRALVFTNSGLLGKRSAGKDKQLAELVDSQTPYFKEVSSRGSERGTDGWGYCPGALRRPNGPSASSPSPTGVTRPDDFQSCSLFARSLAPANEAGRINRAKQTTPIIKERDPAVRHENPAGDNQPPRRRPANWPNRFPRNSG